MNFLKSINIFTWKKTEYSEFYIATLISIFPFTFGKTFIVGIASWFLSAFQAIFLYAPQENEIWWSLVLVCFITVMLIKLFIVEPLGFKANIEAKTSWETFLTGVAVIGFFIFIVCLRFTEVNLPDFPLWFKRFIQPSLATFSSTTSAAEKNFWSIVPWIWVIAPLALFYFSLIKKNIGSSEAGK